MKRYGPLGSTKNPKALFFYSKNLTNLLKYDLIKNQITNYLKYEMVFQKKFNYS